MEERIFGEGEEVGGARRRRGGGRKVAEDERGESKTLRERENNALKQQPATTLIGHFVHLFDLFKLWDN